MVKFNGKIDLAEALHEPDGQTIKGTPKTLEEQAFDWATKFLARKDIKKVTDVRDWLIENIHLNKEDWVSRAFNFYRSRGEEPKIAYNDRSFDNSEVDNFIVGVVTGEHMAGDWSGFVLENYTMPKDYWTRIRGIKFQRVD